MIIPALRPTIPICRVQPSSVMPTCSLSTSIAGAGRAPALERASQILIVLIGLWLLWRAFRPHLDHHDRSAPLLAIATGLIPCPLTTFIMTYAATHGAVRWGLLLSALFAAGMT